MFIITGCEENANQNNPVRYPVSLANILNLENNKYCKVEQLKQEKKHLQDQKENENEKIAHVQEALKTEILVSTECDLQSALTHTQQVTNERELEHESLTSRPQASQQHVAELVMKLSAITTMQNETEKKNLQLMKDLNNVKLQLQEKTKSYDDLQEVNIQLQEKLEVLQTQKVNMKNRIRKFQQALVERAALKRQLNNLKRLVITLNLERDNFVEDLRKEKSTWKENELREEKKQGVGQENQSLEQKKQLWRLKKKAEDGDQHAKNWHQILESLKCAHVHNTELKDQLAQMQDAFHRVSGEKEELTSILNSKHQVKKHMHEKLEQQEEKLREWKVMAEIKSQVVQNLQELHDQCLAHLQELTATCEQHIASNQQLASEEETLQQHLLKKTQMLEQLKQGQTQTKFKDQMVPQKLQNILKCLEATRLQKEQLQAQLSFLPVPKEGEGVSNEEEKGEESTLPDMTFQEDVDNPQTRRDFYLKAPSVAESKKVKFSEQLQDQQACCRFLANLTALCQTKLEKQPFFPKSWKHGVSGDKKQDRQVPKKQLKICFIHNLPGCSQLSEHLSAIEESIVFCKEQLEVLKELFQEKDECVNQMSQEKMEKKAKLQKLLLLLANEVTECQGKMPEDTETPAAATISGPMEIEFRGEQKGLEVQLKDNVEPAQEGVRVPCLLEDSTKEHVLWMPDVQHHQELACLANERSVSFFSRLMQMISLR
ncbi:PREDICTED: golgin subfamily A member 2-like [Dipodomys ordii]|uniref:Golgin subfamily A member 2-like n=1 Tax=Dipodomys ordii TaxID=10020 RepID=A0A1S3FLI5_DIPOR|nr:PREDICTED: golgin subfamily A member 2-like [Dipodomys ordii]